MSDSEHSRVPLVLAERISGVQQAGKCEIGIGERSFFVPKNFKLRTLAGIKNTVKAAPAAVSKKSQTVKFITNEKILATSQIEVLKKYFNKNCLLGLN